MSESEPIDLNRRQALVRDGESSVGGRHSTRGAANAASASRRSVFFNRRELDIILRVYGRQVAAGEWRDYAIDQTDEEAVFSVFRRTSEMPLYRIFKAPRDARRQGAYRIVGASGMIVKRGHDLAQVLKAVQKRRLRVVGA